MKSWASFSATDINNDNQLDAKELKFMIWLVDGYEPDDRRIAKDMELIDTDQNGTIDRIEWIKYLASPDGEGAAYFNFGLKKRFDLYDQDKDGRVNSEEFEAIIQETFSKEIDTKTEKGQVIATKMVKALSIELFRLMDLDGEGLVDWCEFKNYANIDKEKFK